MKTKILFFLLPSVLFVTAFRLPVLDFLAKLQEKYQSYMRIVPQEKIYAHIDKMYYKPNDMVWFKAYIVDGNTHKPTTTSSVVYAELLDPKGNVVEKQTLHIADGTAHSGFILQEAVGGLYKVRFYTQWSQNFGEKGIFEKNIQIQKFVAPAMLLKLNFPRKSHGAGEQVTADLEARSLDNFPISNTEFDFMVMLAGNKHLDSKATTDREGKAKITFTLPTDLQTEDGLLNVKVNFAGKSESISRSVPITLNQVSLAFFPEGGDLIAGVQSKVAFQALSKSGKPADISGQLLDNQNKVVVTFKSMHQGMGSFVFTPKTNENYRVQLTAPAGIAQSYALPTIQAEGFALAVDTVMKENIQVRFHSPRAEEVYLVAQSAGKIHFSQKINAQQGKNTLSIASQDFPIGIVRLTLFDQNENPRAERIAFAHAHKTLKVKLKTNKNTYKPREKVTVDITTTDEAGKPVSANLSMAVVDDKIWTMADDKQDNILSYLLMSHELTGKIDEPNFYFKKDEPLAPLALEHLMLTRGWRRFVWKEILGDMPKLAYLPEKIDMLAGKIISTKKNKPVEGYITLMELTGSQRAMRIKTDKEGNFAFKGFDPSQALQLVVDDKQGDLYAVLESGWELSNPYYNYQVRSELYGSRSKIADGNDIIDLSFKNDKAVAKPVQPIEQIENVRGVGSVSLEDDQTLSEVVVMGYRGDLNRDILESKTAGMQIRGYSSLGSTTTITAREIGGYDGIASGEAMNGQNLLRQNGVVHIYRENQRELAGRKAYYNPLKSYQLHKKQYTIARLYAPTIYEPRKYESKDQHPAERTDFRSTVFWQSNIYTDAKGEAQVSFYNSDDLTTFRIAVEGIGANGLIGREENTYNVQRALNIETKLPAYATVSDTIKLAVYIKNNLPTPAEGKLTVNASSAWDIKTQMPLKIHLPAQQGETFYIHCVAKAIEARSSLQLYFESEEMNDLSKYEIEVRNIGFPTSFSLSGNQVQQKHAFDYTKGVEGSTKAELTFFPNVLDEVMAGIDGIIREPYGCFEQVTSSTYPNVMALQYLRESGKTNQDIESRALGYIEKGYHKLIGYEVNGGGFDWYGRGPAHIGLTSLGIMEFTDMKEVYPDVSSKMINRTCEWLLEQRTGNGSFKNSSPAQDAYVIFALAESNFEASKFEKEYENAYQEALKSEDAYRLALLAYSSFKMNKPKEATKLLDILEKQVTKIGLGKLSASASMVGSYGYSLQIETASLILMAVLKSEKPDNTLINDLVNYIASQRKYGTFGSTQGTVLALKALLRYKKYNAQLWTKDAKIQVKLNNHQQEITIAPDKAGKVLIAGLESYLQVGKNSFEVIFEDKKQVVPYTLDVAWNAYIPQASPQCEVAVKTALASRTVKVNETVRLTATLQNKKNKEQASSMAIVGIPSGLTAQAWQLKELQEKNVFDFYEIHKNYVVFYYKGLAPKETKTIHLDLKAEVKGTYQAPASSGYLYYTNEFRDWIAGEMVIIE